MPDDDNITDLGVRFKDPVSDEKMLNIVSRRNGCFDHSYVIDAEAEEVTCSKCDKTFNPMSVLMDLAQKESRWMRNMEQYNDEMKRLSERSRTKCDNCGQMTRISKR